jgi:hypothetical protein
MIGKTTGVLRKMNVVTGTETLLATTTSIATTIGITTVAETGILAESGKGNVGQMVIAHHSLRRRNLMRLRWMLQVRSCIVSTSDICPSFIPPGGSASASGALEDGEEMQMDAVDGEEEAMMAMMGMSGFGSTKVRGFE